MKLLFSCSIKISLSCDKRFLETTDNKFKTIIKHRGPLASNTSLHCSIFNVQDCYNKEDDTYFSEFTWCAVLYKVIFCLFVCLFFCLKVMVMVINATFNNISIILCKSFIGGGNRSTRKKATYLPQVTDKLYHIGL